MIQGMATETEIEEARRRTDGAADWESDDIRRYLDTGKTIVDFARMWWESKAASYSKLVNISESGSSRSNGDLYKNALAMAKHFGSEDATGVPDGPVNNKTTRRAVRR